MSNAEGNYGDILNQSWGEIPEPKVLPVGSYLLKGRNASFQPRKDENQSDKVLFFYEPVEAMNDVDAKSLEELGDYDMSETDVVATIFINRKKDWDKVRKHLALHGVDVTAAGGIQDSLKAFKGSNVVAYLEQRTFTTSTGAVVTNNQPTLFQEAQ